MENFTEIITGFIEDSGMSLRDLAKASGVSASQYSSYTRGSIPELKVAVRIADYFKCSLDYLFGLSDSKKKSDKAGYDINLFLPRYLGLLKEHNISHWKFCQNNKLNESNMRNWEKGKEPKFEKLVFIALTLGTSIDYLVGRTDKK